MCLIRAHPKRAGVPFSPSLLASLFIYPRLPPASLCPLVSLVLSTQRCRAFLRMSTFSETAWLCLAVPAALGGIVLYKLKKSPGQVGRKVVCLAGLWAGAYLLSLSLFWGWVLFPLSCFLMCAYLSGHEFLPVDQKAVLITGKWTALQLSLRAGSGICLTSVSLFQSRFPDKILGME